MKTVKRLVCVSLFFIAFNGYSASKDIPEAARQMVAGLSKQLTISNLDVSIGNLTLIDSQFSSEFAKNFLIYLESEMISHPDFSTVKPQKIMRTRGFSTIDEDEDEEVQHKVSMAGKYRIQGEQVFVSIRLLDNNGSRIAEHEVSVDRSAIPWKLNPPNIKKIKRAEDNINKVQKQKNVFRTALEIDKGNSGVYVEGEELKVFFRTEKDCYLKVLYIDVNQNRILIYPTERDSREILRAGQDHALHTNNKFTIQEPFGTEMILGFCSTKPMGAANEINLGGGFSGFDANTSTSDVIKNMRGIGISDHKMEQSETRAYLTTVPRNTVCSNTRGIGVSAKNCQ